MERSHFGFERQPFRPTVEPDSYFPAGSHGAALTAIAAAFARCDPIVLLDGPAGVGKSLVARKWLEGLLAEVPRIVVPNARAQRPGELFQAILFDLAKPYSGLAEQELRLAVTEHLLEAGIQSPFPTVLVLDEAQHLGDESLEEVRLLSNLQTRHGAALFTLLIAQPSLRDRLQEPLASRVAIRAVVTPISTAESADYLRHQLNAAGAKAGEIFTEEAIRYFADAAHGVARMLNRLGTLALELAAAGEAEQVDVEVAMEAVAQLGLPPVELHESAGPVILPHPVRDETPARARRTKSTKTRLADAAGTERDSKNRPAKKRSA